MPKVIWCKCGMRIENNACKRCGKSWKPFGGEKRERIGSFSGYSKNKEWNIGWRTKK